MHVALTPDQIRLREELRRLLRGPGHAGGPCGPRGRVRPVRSGEFGDADVYKRVIRQLGSDGWLGIGWPEEYGGQARSMVEQLIFTDAAAIAGVPIPYLTLNTVGPTIMRYGTDEQKAYFLPQDPGRRPALLDRLLRARLGHRPRVAEDPRRARRRRVGHQRPEDVDLASSSTPTRSGSPAAPTPTCRATRDSRSSWCRPTPTASPTRRSTPSPVSAPARPTTRTCGCRRPTWSASSTAAGR